MVVLFHSCCSRAAARRTPLSFSLAATTQNTQDQPSKSATHQRVEEIHEDKLIQDAFRFSHRSLCPEDMPFCSDPLVYPTEAAKLALKQLKSEKNHKYQLFNRRTKTTPDPLEIYDGEAGLALASIHGDKFEDTCQSKPFNEPIKLALNKNKEFKFILNVPGEFEQIFFGEKCVEGPYPGDQHQQCDFDDKHNKDIEDFLGHFGVRPSCEQKYSEAKLLTLIQDGQYKEQFYLQEDYFHLPSACICRKQSWRWAGGDRDPAAGNYGGIKACLAIALLISLLGVILFYKKIKKSKSHKYQKPAKVNPDMVEPVDSENDH